MPIRITGLNSGLDTESLVSELVSAYRKKGEKYEKAQTKISWKQEAWKTMSAQISSFRKSLDSLRFSTGYNLKTTSVSNSTKVSVTAGNNAVNGSQTLQITALAKTGYLTGGVLSRADKKAAASDTSLSTLGFNGEGKVSLNGKEITLDGSMTVQDAINKFADAGVNASFDAANQRIFVSSKKSGKDNDFSLTALDENGAQALKSLGLYVKSSTSNALYDDYAKYNGQNLEALLQQYNDNAGIVKDAKDTSGYLSKALAYASAKETVADLNNKLAAGTLTSDEVDRAKSLLADKDKLVMADGTTFTYHKSDDGEEYYTNDSENVADGASPTKYYLTVSTTTKQEAEKDDKGNPVLDKDGNPVMKDVKVETRYLTTTKEFNAVDPDAVDAAIKVQTADNYLKDSAQLTDDEISGYRSAQDTITNMQKSVQEELDAKAAEEQKAAEAGETYVDPSTEGNYTAYRSLASVMSLVDNGMTADEVKAEQNRIASEQTAAQDAMDENSVLENYAKQYGAATDDTTRGEVLQELNKHIQYAVDMKGKTDEAKGYNTDAVRVDGQDAAITLNGADYTSSSSTFSINGLTINALAVTDKNEVLTITTSTDNQGIYDKIKDFLSGYNSLINAMTSSYNAASSKDYEPLTDDEKEAMSEKEIEKWEEKGKSGILRRDSTLSKLMSVLTGAMSKSHTIGGKNYALSSFGIKTLGIINAEKNEHNAYHIDGDADDESTSANTDKLMAAIIEDPDGVTEFFQKLSNELYDKLGEQMTSTTMRSYGSFYNDKKMDKEYSDYTKTISDWEKKVADIEDSYYKKFAAMESALAKLQSSSSQLAGLLGS